MAAAALVTCIATPAVADEAVTYQIDAAHSGAEPQDQLTPPLHRLWTRDFPGKVSYAMIAGGRIFVTVGTQDPTAANAGPGTVYALDERTGATQWSRSDIGGAWSDPAYDNGLLFVNDSGDTLRAYRASDGTPLWSAGPDSGQQALTPPVAAGGLVFTSSGADGATLYARRESDGSVAWRSTAIQNNGQESAPALDAAHLYVTYGCSNTFAFDRGTGATAWTWNNVCSSGGGVAPVAHDGTVWSRPLGGTADNGDILAASDGHHVGSFVSASPPAFGSDTVVLEHGYAARGQDLAGGAQLWSFSGDGQIVLAPVVVGRTAYVGSLGGHLYGLDLRSGAVRWSDDVGVPFDSNDTVGPGFPTPGLAVADGVLVASARTRLVAYSGSSGGPAAQQPQGRRQAGACRGRTRLRCRAHVGGSAQRSFSARLLHGSVVYARGHATAARGLVRAHLSRRRAIPPGTYVLALRARRAHLSVLVSVR